MQVWQSTLICLLEPSFHIHAGSEVKVQTDMSITCQPVVLVKWHQEISHQLPSLPLSSMQPVLIG